MKTFKKLVGTFMIGSLLILNCDVVNAQKKEVAGKSTIKTVKIGTQEWLALNLNVSKFRNGDEIDEAKTDEDWKKAGMEKKPAWCYYENDIENGNKYGKLYNWYAVNDKRGIAPAGWRVPGNGDWVNLSKFSGGVDIAGKRLKDKTGWKAGNGDNKSGFMAVPGGCRMADGKFNDVGLKCQMWSTSGTIGGGAEVYSLMILSSSVEVSYIKLAKDNGLSIRCIKE